MKQDPGKNPVPPEKVRKVMEILDRAYPDASCSLKFKSPLQLMIATILSAQCTDERVNMVTPELFRKYPTAAALGNAPPEEIEEEIRTTGFFRNKTKSIQGACRDIEAKYGGEVPADLDELVKLPGIGRKTANVILGNSFGIPGIVVDTHVARVTARIGLTVNKDPEKIERDLMILIPRDHWVKFCHEIIQHGRQICQAKKPKCSVCPILPHCDYGQSATNRE